jgi:hypothetical protein
MNDRVGASMHSSGVQLELTALAWRRTSLSVPANASPLRNWITAKSHVRQRHATRLPRGQVSQEWRASHYVSAETRKTQIRRISREATLRERK